MSIQGAAVKGQLENKDFLPVILAAGFGKRLGAQTQSLPKALVPVATGRLIDCALWQLRQLGFKEVVINLHYHGNLIKEYLATKNLDLKIYYSEEEPILDTGGAIKKIFQEFTPNNLLIINCDSVFGWGLAPQIRAWVTGFPLSAAVASLLVRTLPDEVAGGTFAKLGFRDGVLSTIKNPPPHEELVTFLGLQLVSNTITEQLKLMPDIFGTFETLYPSILATGLKVTSQVYNGDWWDAGTPERLEAVNNAVMDGRVSLL